MNIRVFLTFKETLNSYLTTRCRLPKKSILSEKYITEGERIQVVFDRQLLVHNHYLHLIEFQKLKDIY